eukprot:Colp12_sorted_trinity150504_noHs@30720
MDVAVKTGRDHDDQFHFCEVDGTACEVPIRYDSLKHVGKGAFGQVFAAEDRVSNQMVAIKKVLKPFDTNVHGKRTYREIKLLRSLGHDNVIGLKDLFTPAPSYDRFSEVYFVTELMAVDLNEVIKTTPLDENIVRLFVYQILRGLKYIHSAGVIHRDLKPSNIAVNNEDGSLKILDFGLARTYDSQMTGYVATRWYRAPEIMLSWRRYNHQADVWSVGCIMFELLSSGPGSRPLFQGTNHIDQLNKIVQIVGVPSDDFISNIQEEGTRQYVKSLPRYKGYPIGQLLPEDVRPHVSAEALDLMQRMLIIDPHKRITTEDALAHPFLALYHSPDDEPVAAGEVDLGFEEQNYTAEQWRELVWEQLQSYRAERANSPPV